MPRHFDLTDIAFKVTVVAVEWVALFQLNALFLSDFTYSERASWIFLPAALRVMSVLLFGWAGAAGLVIGSLLTLPHNLPADLVYEVALALTSGAAPLIAIGEYRRYFAIPSTLSSLGITHIVGASIATATVNGVLVNACMAMAGRWNDDVEQIATIFVGDTLGAAIVLAFIALLARLIPFGPK